MLFLVMAIEAQSIRACGRGDSGRRSDFDKWWSVVDVFVTPTPYQNLQLVNSDAFHPKPTKLKAAQSAAVVHLRQGPTVWFTT